MKQHTIAITLGDPGGIGPEVIVKVFAGFKGSRDFRYVIFGIPEVFYFLEKEYGLSLPFKHKSIIFVDVSKQAASLLPPLKKGKRKKHPAFEIGKVSAVNASIAYAALQVATSLAVKGEVDALVTAPVNKTSIRLIDANFKGHTEYLAQASHVSKYAMMFVHDRLKVTLATIHVSLRKVSDLITPELVYEKIRLTNQFMRTYFNLPKPRIAVCALNPHGAETGKEDPLVVLPAVRRARAAKMEVVGPLSADQLFHDAYEGRFDAVISMYHDQGLAPFKMIAFRDGVNVTLGLPFIRTSPDHGTAFDIAYQNKAQSDSMRAALKLAERLLLPK